jgi:hypothetical protein
VGRLTRVGLALLVTAALGAVGAPPVTHGFTGFGSMSAEATFGVEMRFAVDLSGDPPDRLELLLRFAGDDGVFVAPVEAGADEAVYVWDAADRHVTPNTRITYAWRAHDAEGTTLSREGTLVYDDDRAGLDWRSARYGEATVHWYGDAEGVAARFGELAATGTVRAERLLGHELAAPVDIFVYNTSDAFFGALGPGAREWTGAATYPAIRTIFMSLGSGGQDYLETTLVHEVAHVVFDDATDNPFHEPAKWLNEGLATWSESEDADDERSAVAFEASGGGLFAFEAIAQQFPIGERGARLAYAQGATMVDMIVAEHGPEAIARIAAAYRDGASDAEALEAGTGTDAGALYAAFFDEFGVEAPAPVEPAPIPPSNVRRPDGRGGTVDGGPTSSRSPDRAPAPGEGDPVPWMAVIGIVAVLAAVVAAALVTGRRSVAGTRS